MHNLKSYYLIDSKLEKTITNLNITILSIGALGNVLSLFTFLQKDLLKLKFNWYLLTITIFEIFCCCTGFIDYIFPKICDRDIFLHDLSKISYITVDYILHTSDACIVVLTFLLSIDRLYAIKHPLKIKEFITNLHAKKTIFISLLSLVSLKTLSFVLCELNIGNKRFILYCSLVSPFMFIAIPLIVILIINIMLAKELWVYNKKLDTDYYIENTLNVEYSKRNTIVVINFRKTVTALRNPRNKGYKSHYVVILISSIWSILTSISYYSFLTYDFLFQFNIFSNNFDLKSITKIQAISSVLFNSSHCIHFFIYLSFHSEFRNIFRKIFFKISRVKKIPKL